MIWTMAFWVKRDFFMMKTFFFPSPFFTFLERTQNTFTELTEIWRKFFGLVLLIAFWGLRLICAGQCHVRRATALNLHVWEEYERFRDICHKPCDVSSQLLFLNVSSRVVNNVIVYQNFCNLSTKKYVCTLEFRI